MEIRRLGFIPGEHVRRETLFHVANGYLGMRGSFEEGTPPGVRSVRGTYINGFFDSSDIHYEEKLHGFASIQQSIVNVIDTQGISLDLDGEAFSLSAGKVRDFRQVLDIETGVYTRSLIWTSPRGKRTEIVFRRLASFILPSLALIHAELKPLDWSGAVRLTSSQRGDVLQDSDPNDPRKASVGRKMLRVTSALEQDGAMLMTAETLHSRLTMASAVSHRWQGGFTIGHRVGEMISEAMLVGRVKAGEAVSLTKYCVYTDSRRFEDPAEQALELLGQALKLDFPGWAERQSEYLDRFWQRAGAQIKGNEPLDASLSWSMYTLLASAGKDGIGNIASKGLSGEGYEGHYFWDTEIYMFPFFLLTSPDIARDLLRSRAAMLPEAIRHAREMGHEVGALYAWRTITGSECSAYFPSGSAQYHINGAVAHAFLTYWQVTGDLSFMAEEGAEVLIQTARLWLDAGHWQAGQFRIDSVTGPDEYSCIVNNNYYTNRSAQSHLRGTVKLCEALRNNGMLREAQERTSLAEAELDQFRHAAEAMYLPFDSDLGICAQDDAFLSKKRLDLSQIPKERFPLLMHYHPLFLYRHQVCKQADTVLAHFLYEEGEDEAAIRRGYEYYEEITTHDSSLSECIFSMMAARTGRPEKAYDYYRRTAALDLEDTHGNTADGIHAANMGGCWMGIVFGFAGLRLHWNGLAFRPCLPDKMEGYSFRLTWRGTGMQVLVQGGEALFMIQSGPGLELSVYDQEYRVEYELRVPIKANAGET